MAATNALSGASSRLAWRNVRLALQGSSVALREHLKLGRATFAWLLVRCVRTALLGVTWQPLALAFATAVGKVRPAKARSSAGQARSWLKWARPNARSVQLAAIPTRPWMQASYRKGNMTCLIKAYHTYIITVDWPPSISDM